MYPDRCLCSDNEQHPRENPQLNQILGTILNTDTIVLLGDFYIRVYQSHFPWVKVLRKFGTGKANASQWQSAAQNIRWSLRTPTSKSAQDPNTGTSLTTSSSDNMICQTFWTQKRWEEPTVVLTMLWSSSLPNYKWGGEWRKRKCQTGSSQSRSSVRDNFQVTINDKLVEIPGVTVEEKWDTFKSIVYKVSKEKLGSAIRKHENWFDRNSLELEELINNRIRARNNMLSKNVCKGQI